MSTDYDNQAQTPRWWRRQTRKAAVVAAASVSAAGLLGGGLAYATTSSSGTVYTACLSKGGHSVYNVTTDGTSKCHGNDTTITWNQTGPQGAQGPAGVAGPQGAKGDTGATGTVGPAGLPGLKGDSGAIGPAGPVGPKGDTGTTGLAGPTGATGPQGPAGPGVYSVATTSDFPASSYNDITVSCHSPSDLAISGGDVPVGLNYNNAAAQFAEYHTEWSGPADNNSWTWHFQNSAPESINMEFVVFCQKG
jgi:hypothetical protein